MTNEIINYMVDGIKMSKKAFLKKTSYNISNDIIEIDKKKHRIKNGLIVLSIN